MRKTTKNEKQIENVDKTTTIITPLSPYNCKVCGCETSLKDRKHRTSERHLNVEKIIENVKKLSDEMIKNLAEKIPK
jgi:hypothetical protein